MTLTLGWANHLQATHSAVREALATIRRLAVEGTSLGGIGGRPLEPLPVEEWKRFEGDLDEIQTEIDALVEEMAPDETARQHALRPLSVTRYQLLLALTMLEEEQIDDIDPAKGSPYGALDPEDRTRLEQSTRSMRSIVARLRSELSGGA